MKYGVHVPLMGDLSDPGAATALAIEAEIAGWDGFFVWDHISPPWHPLCGDATVTLAAIAARTNRIRIGPMVCPIARRRPWKVARETAALDILSGGRLTFGVGLGGFRREFGDLGEEHDLRTRAALVDESLEIATRLWSGERFQWRGRHFNVRGEAFLPTPIQSPGIPVWTAARWSVPETWDRAARWQGVFPTLGEVSQDQALERMATMAAGIRDRRGTLDGFDIARGGETHISATAANRSLLEQYQGVGVTWWMENLNPSRWVWEPWPANQILRRVREGPPG